ncbi:helix-turn-helix transcriptional regulator [Streptomyces paromomycinus]|uniref:Helix-turn-helix transcriptional regulator n=1 Tax=Streptomyces paromomycinus TaxID=92743 RepID=A0A401WFS1_STREY|nr:response regulator transcription factor [Streptomyces paromomycinus]GCD48130.1 helix-turn-helix transcriptional regulator [Streptomyces paromomycinus]
MAVPPPDGRPPRVAGAPHLTALRPPTDRGGRPAGTERSTDPVSVVVLADDPITLDGTVAFLRSNPLISVVGDDRLTEADVVLILVSPEGTDEALARLGRRDAWQRPSQRLILVADSVSEYQLMRAVAHGLTDVLPRAQSDLGAIADAVCDRRQRTGVADSLVTLLHHLQRDILEPHRLNAAGFDAREMSILRMLADGWSTGEVAKELGYSERTIKNAIHTMLARLGLRNRTHAVAHAIRSGTV